MTSEPMSPERLDPAQIMQRHRKSNSRDDWCAARSCPAPWPCLPYRLAAEVQRLQGVEREWDEARGQVERVRMVHARYFDLDGQPGADDTNPEPEDVWRFDRDFRVALAVPDQPTEHPEAETGECQCPTCEGEHSCPACLVVPDQSTAEGS